MTPVAWRAGRRRTDRRVAASAIALALPIALVGVSPARAADPVTPVIERFRAEIPRLMAEQGVPGLSVAVVDGERPLWVEGFGHVDGPDSAPVTADTIFSVQSMSKLFTATAVMQAVQDGLVALDEPITTYLPDFTVHSAFEAHPEQKITLRMLLSHTAGFTLEAPIGNNNDLEPGTFDEHVRSISDTWLRYPVGDGYGYSNLDIDLAGYILARVRERPFAQVMDETLLAPIGMTQSTFDRERIRATPDRAIGHNDGVAAWLVDMPMTAAGGLYASAADLARFLGFQIQGGTVGGRAILDPSLIQEMRTVPAPNAGAPAGYALGVERTRWRAEGYQDLFLHGGGGFGFLSDLWWAPSIGIGVAVLTNSTNHQLQENLALSILRGFVDEPGSVFGRRVAELPPQADFEVEGGRFDPPANLGALVEAAAMPSTVDQAARWTEYTRSYRIPSWGLIDPTAPPDRFLVDAGAPYFETADTGTLTRYRLTEIQPGLFLADNGEVLDLRSTPPTWRNLDLAPAQGGPLPWQAAIMALVVVVSAGWLLVTFVLVVRRRARRTQAGDAGVPGPARPLTVVASVTAVVAMATVALVVAVPGLVDSGFIGWVHPDLGPRLVLHLPLAVAVLAAALATMVTIAWLRRSWSVGDRVRYTVLAVAVVGLTAQLAAWHLIGWGF